MFLVSFIWFSSHRPDQVLKRCYTTLLPWSPSYLSAHLTPAADLYGPFWTLTTLIFCLYVFSSLAHSIVSYLSDEPIDYDFSLLSTAFALVYAYSLGWPALLWVALRYYGLGEWSLIEAIAGVSRSPGGLWSCRRYRRTNSRKRC
jgi:hypothetical protein